MEVGQGSLYSPSSGAFPSRQLLAAALLLAGLGWIAAGAVPHFSRDRVVNEIANNGTISFLNAFFTRNLDYSAFYRTLPKAEAYARAAGLLGATNTSLGSLQRNVAPYRETRPLNV